MAEQNPHYSLEFILEYDQGSLTFNASSDNPWVLWCAAGEIEHLNRSTVSNHVHNGRKVVVAIYKDGQTLERGALGEEIKQYADKKRQEKGG